MQRVFNSSWYRSTKTPFRIWIEWIDLICPRERLSFMSRETSSFKWKSFRHLEVIWFGISIKFESASAASAVSSKQRNWWPFGPPVSMRSKSSRWESHSVTLISSEPLGFASELCAWMQVWFLPEPKKSSFRCVSFSFSFELDRCIFVFVFAFAFVLVFVFDSWARHVHRALHEFFFNFNTTPQIDDVVVVGTSPKKLCELKTLSTSDPQKAVTTGRAKSVLKPFLEAFLIASKIHQVCEEKGI